MNSSAPTGTPCIICKGMARAGPALTQHCREQRHLPPRRMTKPPAVQAGAERAHSNDHAGRSCTAAWQPSLTAVPPLTERGHHGITVHLQFMAKRRRMGSVNSQASSRQAYMHMPWPMVLSHAAADPPAPSPFMAPLPPYAHEQSHQPHTNGALLRPSQSTLLPASPPSPGTSVCPQTP